jgi:predicted MFS family arabinose efflux permease
MALFCLGCTIVIIWPSYWPFGIVLAIIALAKVIYDPAMQAYLGDAVPYKNRGKAISITELSWAGAFFLGVPALGLVMQSQGWPAPFVWLGLFGIGAAILIWRLLPGPSADGRAGQVTNLRTTVAVIRRQPVIWAAAGYVLLIMAANELILIVYGGWMEESFGLSLASLGLATSVIGAAEVIAELSVGVAVDHYGKRPVVITTGLLGTLMYLIVPQSGSSLIFALIALFFLFLFFEMTVVGAIPLLTEIVPSARSLVMSVVLAFGSLGRGIGALIGQPILTRGGFTTLGIVAAVTMLVGILILAGWIREDFDRAPETEQSKVRSVDV